MLHYLLTDITCPPVQEVDKAFRNTSLAIHGTFVAFRCHYGHWFPDKEYEKVVLCSNGGNWSETLDPCKCKSHSYPVDIYQELTANLLESETPLRSSEFC